MARITNGRGAAVLPSGRVSLSLSHRPQPPGTSNMSREQYLAGVAAAQVKHRTKQPNTKHICLDQNRSQTPGTSNMLVKQYLASVAAAQVLNISGLGAQLSCCALQQMQCSDICRSSLQTGRAHQASP